MAEKPTPVVTLGNCKQAWKVLVNAKVKDLIMKGRAVRDADVVTVILRLLETDLINEFCVAITDEQYDAAYFDTMLLPDIKQLVADFFVNIGDVFPELAILAEKGKEFSTKISSKVGSIPSPASDSPTPSESGLMTESSTSEKPTKKRKDSKTE